MAIKLARNLPDPLRTPELLLHGVSNTRGDLSNVEWLLWEWIETDTIEDIVAAPNLDEIIEQNVMRKLSKPLRNLDPSILEDARQFLPQYESIESYVDYLQNELSPLITLPDSALGFNPGQSILKVKEMIKKAKCGKKSVGKVCLIHQDLNWGNVLCSQIQQTENWALDAVIDWESAALAPIEFLRDSSRPDLETLFMFGMVLRNAWLASGFATDPSRLPSCDFMALMENTTEWVEKLKNAGLLVSH